MVAIIATVIRMTDPPPLEARSPLFLGRSGGETVPTHRSIEQKRIDQEDLKKERMALASAGS
jgi:hypothetical protein